VSNKTHLYKKICWWGFKVEIELGANVVTELPIDSFIIKCKCTHPAVSCAFVLTSDQNGQTQHRGPVQKILFIDSLANIRKTCSLLCSADL
jgi:hypothetical protein